MIYIAYNISGKGYRHCFEDDKSCFEPDLDIVAAGIAVADTAVVESDTYWDCIHYLNSFAPYCFRRHLNRP